MQSIEFSLASISFINRAFRIQNPPENHRLAPQSRRTGLFGLHHAEVNEESDNPPIGILLVAVQKKRSSNTPLLIYQNLLVREYLLQLASKEELTSFIQREIANL